MWSMLFKMDLCISTLDPHSIILIGLIPAIFFRSWFHLAEEHAKLRFDIDIDYDFNQFCSI